MGGFIRRSASRTGKDVGQVGLVRQVGQVRQVGVVKGSRVFGNEVMTFFLFFSVKKIISFV